MTAYVPPRRKASTSTTITVQSSSSALPSWVPDISDGIGRFNNIYRADLPGQIDTVNRINPDYFFEDGTSRATTAAPYYRNIFSYNAGTTTQIFQLLESQAGAAFSPLLGAHGSIVMHNGGHFTLGGPWTVAFDLAEGKWKHLRYPILTNVDKSISIQFGLFPTPTGTVVKRGSGTSPPQWDQPPDSSRQDEQSPAAIANRVAKTGNYIKYADDTPIPGAGDVNGVGATVFNPYPPHTYCGILDLPPEGGGGPLGSLLLASHSQTGTNVQETHYQVFKLDYSTMVWDTFSGIGGWGQNYVMPLFSVKAVALEFDSGRNLIWYVGGTRPLVMDFKSKPYRWHITDGANFNQNSLGPGICYIPGRDMFIYIKAIGDTPNYSFRIPYLYGFSVKNYTFGTAFTWSEIRLNVNPPHGAPYKAALDANTDTGWPGFKNGTTYGDDNGDLMQGQYRLNEGSPGNPVGYTQPTRGTNDRLQYCEAEDCIIFLPRRRGTIHGVPRDQQTTLDIWKLRMPAKGAEFTGTWTWEKETTQQTVGCGGAAMKQYNMNPCWAGRGGVYVPTLKCMYYIDSTDFPVQVIRSKAWV